MASRRRSRRRRGLFFNLTRFIGPMGTVVGIAILVIGTLLGFFRLPGNNPPLAAQQLDGDKPTETIRVATFNIQTFGNKKSSNVEILQQIAAIVSKFDVVAIQEVRSPKEAPIDRLVNQLNYAGGRFDYLLSQPLGTGTYKEQYAFVWDTTRIRLVPQSGYVVNDAENKMPREPMVATFETIPPRTPVGGTLPGGTPADSSVTLASATLPATKGSTGSANPTNSATRKTPFRFTLINVHTDPDRVSASSKINELDVLDDVFNSVRQFEQQRGSDDVILLGDLNVNQKHLGELGRIPHIRSLQNDQTPTNTAGTKVLDHIMIDVRSTTEFTNVSGVYVFEDELKIDRSAAESISDHRPVWAEFRRWR